MKKVCGLLLMAMMVSTGCMNSNGHHAQQKTSKVLQDPCSDTSYFSLLQRIKNKKAAFKTTYLRSQNRPKLMDSCRKYLQTMLADSLFARWEGTSWAFYGTTEIPKCGDIACGYFVSTLLRDLGFHIPRVRWAQAASETFIREFCNNQVYHQVNKTQEEVMQFVDNCKGSYYLVGLDTHVGIIEKRNGEINFIHSAEYMDAHGVTREPASSENPFAVSRYRVFGELFTDVQVVNWMLDKSYY
jgi:hypothetical protein